MRSNQTSMVSILVELLSRNDLLAQLENELFRLRPLAVTGRGIQVTDSAYVDQLTAPVSGHGFDTLEFGERVVGARRNDARERQLATRNRQPAVVAQVFKRGI